MVQSWRGGDRQDLRREFLAEPLLGFLRSDYNRAWETAVSQSQDLGDDISDGSPRHLLGTQVLPKRGQMCPKAGKASAALQHQSHPLGNLQLGPGSLLSCSFLQWGRGGRALPYQGSNRNSAN